jgi:hypothetical protein
LPKGPGQNEPFDPRPLSCCKLCCDKTKEENASFTNENIGVAFGSCLFKGCEEKNACKGDQGSTPVGFGIPETDHPEMTVETELFVSIKLDKMQEILLMRHLK